MTTETDASTKKAPAKRRPPARSAKILAFGLSTTAMLGMTTGYAFADLAKEQAPSDVLPSALDQTLIVDSTQPPTTTPSVVTVPSSQTPQVVTSQQEVVIDVPVPQAPATPGSGNSSWKNQKSSGSN